MKITVRYFTAQVFFTKDDGTTDCIWVKSKSARKADLFRVADAKALEVVGSHIHQPSINAGGWWESYSYDD